MTVPLLALTLAAALGFQAPGAVHLLAEEGAGARVEDRGFGIVELRGSEGWLRVAGVYSDFTLTFAFRDLTKDADAAVVVRSWTGVDGWPSKGYRVPLSAKVARDASKGLLGSRASVSVAESGTASFRGMGEWQQLEVTTEGRRVRVKLNDQQVGVYQVEELAGEILFVNRKGTVEFRDVSLRAIDLTHERPAEGISEAKLKNMGGQPPKLRREVKPNYSRDAMDARIQGVVLLEAAVLADGTVGAVEVTRGLHRDLDRSAIAAARRWYFDPAVLNGKPIATVVEIEMTFKLLK
jgi:TonB family protein